MHGGLFFGQLQERVRCIEFLQQGEGRVLLALFPPDIVNFKAE